VRMIRLAMILVGSGERKDPIATKLGTFHQYEIEELSQGRTLTCTFVSKKKTCSLAETDWTECSGYYCTS